MVGAVTEIGAADIVSRIDRYLERIAPFGFSGTVLVAMSGEVLLNRGYGLADRERRVPNTADTVFNLGSLTKQFTAAAILKLEMLGRLQTTDPISRHLPGVPADKAAVTLHHLLTHTAGLQELDHDDFEMIERERALEETLSAPLQSPPGTQYKYSNTGYSLLAAAVEEASGLEYESFLQQHLFQPAGMASTGYLLPDWRDRVVAHWYVDGADQGIPLDKPYPSWSVIGNGEMLSTTGDMFRWHQALQGERILSIVARRKLYAPFLNDYAYGWEVLDTPHGRVVRHGGTSVYGASAELERYLDAETVLMLFCNQDYAGVLSLAKLVRPKLATLIFGGRVPVPQEVVPVPEAALCPLEGTYRRSEDGAELRCWVEDGALRITGSGQAAFDVLACPDVADHRAYHELNECTQAVLEHAIAGDFGQLEAVAQDPGTRLPRLRRVIGENAGAVEASQVRVLGTLPSSLMEDALDTYVMLEGPKGQASLVVLWRDGMNVGLAVFPTEPQQLASMVFYPQSAREFVGYHLGSGQMAHMRVETGPPGDIAGLTVGVKHGAAFFARETGTAEQG